MDADAGGFADREQSGDDRVRVAVLQRHDLRTIVGWDAAHIVVDRGNDGHGLASEVDPGEGLRRLGDAGQPLGEDLGIDMVEVKPDMVLVLTDPAALANLHRHGARDDNASGEIFGVRSIALHEALALVVGEIAALPACTLGD